MLTQPHRIAALELVSSRVPRVVDGGAGGARCGYEQARGVCAVFTLVFGMQSPSLSQACARFLPFVSFPRRYCEWLLCYTFVSNSMSLFALFCRSQSFGLFIVYSFDLFLVISNFFFFGLLC